MSGREARRSNVGGGLTVLFRLPAWGAAGNTNTYVLLQNATANGLRRLGLEQVHYHYIIVCHLYITTSHAFSTQLISTLSTSHSA